MDIKKLQPEAEVTYELDTAEGTPPISVTFKVRFLALDGVWDYVNESREGTEQPRLSAVIRRAVADAIQGWDLTEGPEALACTRENKDKYLPLLFGLKVKRPVVVEAEGTPALPVNPAADVLVMKLAEFAGAAENFLKN